jgi:hypothetical protein
MGPARVELSYKIAALAVGSRGHITSSRPYTGLGFFDKLGKAFTISFGSKEDVGGDEW